MRKIFTWAVCLLMPAMLAAQEEKDTLGYERDITLEEAIALERNMLVL